MTNLPLSGTKVRHVLSGHAGYVIIGAEEHLRILDNIPACTVQFYNPTADKLEEVNCIKEELLKLYDDC